MQDMVYQFGSAAIFCGDSRFTRTSRLRSGGMSASGIQTQSGAALLSGLLPTLDDILLALGSTLTGLPLGIALHHAIVIQDNGLGPLASKEVMTYLLVFSDRIRHATNCFVASGIGAQKGVQLLYDCGLGSFDTGKFSPDDFSGCLSRLQKYHALFVKVKSDLSSRSGADELLTIARHRLKGLSPEVQSAGNYIVEACHLYDAILILDIEIALCWFQ